MRGCLGRGGVGWGRGCLNTSMLKSAFASATTLQSERPAWNGKSCCGGWGGHGALKSFITFSKCLPDKLFVLYNNMHSVRKSHLHLLHTCIATIVDKTR